MNFCGVQLLGFRDSCYHGVSYPSCLILPLLGHMTLNSLPLSACFLISKISKLDDVIFTLHSLETILGQLSTPTLSLLRLISPPPGSLP